MAVAAVTHIEFYDGWPTVTTVTLYFSILPFADLYLARHLCGFYQAVHNGAMGYDFLSEFSYLGLIIRAFNTKRILQIFKSSGHIIKHKKPPQVERTLDIYRQRIDCKTFMHSKLIKGSLDACRHGGEENFYRVRRLVVSPAASP